MKARGKQLNASAVPARRLGAGAEAVATGTGSARSERRKEGKQRKPAGKGKRIRKS
jgi:hypothetical protein